MPIPRLLLHPVGGAITVAAIWGFNVIFMKIAMADLPPLAFTTLRFLALGLILLPFVKINWSQFRQLLPLALVMGMGHFHLLALGLTYVPGVVASFCLLLGGPLSSLLGYLLLQERLTRWQVLAIAVAALGATVPSFLLGSINLQIGMIIVTCSTFFWALGNIQVRLLPQLPTIALQFWIAIITAPISYLFYTLTGDGTPIWHYLTVSASASLVYVIIASSLIGYALWYRLIHTHGVQQVAPFMLLQPIFTLLAGYLILAEALTLWQWLGSGTTLLAMYIYQRLQKPRL
ncbi:MAG: EamA family transporter [Gammaproteobacteria bacterium]|jgi:O-acetylserine/cysteine efflux transporter|nr:EamA family transporter [Gammaproteobacteria bacterium]